MGDTLSSNRSKVPLKSARVANNSPIILRWLIKNADSLSSENLLPCTVFNEGGFEWKTSIRPHVGGEHFVFFLNCEKKSRDWRCEADSWTINNKVFVEFIIDIISSEHGIEPSPIDLSTFCSPCEANNVTLIIGDHKLRISKDYLAVHSSVFAIMFFGDFAEKDKEKVQIKDVIYEEFIDLLHAISPVDPQISDSSIVQVLALGDRFQMQKVVVATEKHLINSMKFTNVEKLLLSDQYRLDKLRNRCLITYSTWSEIITLKSTPEYAQFSDKMKVAICDRIINLA